MSPSASRALRASVVTARPRASTIRTVAWTSSLGTNDSFHRSPRWTTGGVAVTFLSTGAVVSAVTG